MEVRVHPACTSGPAEAIPPSSVTPATLDIFRNLCEGHHTTKGFLQEPSSIPLPRELITGITERRGAQREVRDDDSFRWAGLLVVEDRLRDVDVGTDL